MIRSFILFFLVVVLFFACMPNIQGQNTTVIEENTVYSSTPENIAKATRFVVYYTGDIAKDLEDPKSYLRTFMDVYELQIINTFEKNDYDKGFTLQPKTLLDSPNETAKELSMVEGVMMIEIVYCKPNTES